MAVITYYADDFGIINLNDSGLGFFGAGFGQSVDVGSHQQTTFITNANGTVEGPQVNNIRYTHQSSGLINSALTSVALTQIPNYLATLNIRFEHENPVVVQNCRFYVYDRVNINNNPSGVLCRVAELIHPDTVQNDNGSGDTAWVTAAGSGSILTLSNSPGISGLYAANGISSTVASTRHDWYICSTNSPSSVGAKLFAGRMRLEYL